MVDQVSAISGGNAPYAGQLSQIKAQSLATAQSSAKTPPGMARSEQELDETDRKELQELKKTDQKVRQHEAAHIAAASGIAISGPQYEFKRGPDGQMYAVGGEVKLDTSEVPNNPEATAQKAQQIEQAALAPADPSAKDRQVANHAKAMENKARMEILKKNRESMQANIQGDKPATKITMATSVPISSYQGSSPEFSSFLNILV